MLHQDVLCYIFDFSDISVLINIVRLNKKFNKLYQRILRKRKFITHLPDGLEINVDDLPILEFKDKFIGSTDYIDRVRISDLSAPVMVGIDRYRRAYIVLRMNFKSKTHNRVETVVHTFFERYTNERQVWTVGTCYGLQFEICQTRLNDEDKLKLNELFDTGKLETKDYFVELI